LVVKGLGVPEGLISGDEVPGYRMGRLAFRQITLEGFGSFTPKLFNAEYESPVSNPGANLTRLEFPAVLWS